MTAPLDSAAAWLATDPPRAERTARALVDAAPADPRPRLILASALRRLGRAAEALPLLTDLATRWPRAARTRYELGMVLHALGRVDEAFAQLDTAVSLDPALREAWAALADLAFAAGDGARDRRARSELARIDAGDPDLGRAAQAIELGEHDRAEAILRPWLLARPNHAEAARLFAQVCIARRTLGAAQDLLRHVLTLEPGHVRARFDLAHCLFAERNGAAALKELAPLLVANPDNAAWINLEAGCLGLIGDDRAAAARHGTLAARFPANPLIAINHGHALRTAGMRDAAIGEYRRALALRPSLGEGWWSLANLKVGTLTADDVTTMRHVLAGPLGRDDRLHCEYALGRAHEDLGEPDPAFAHYAAGAALVRAGQGTLDRNYASYAARMAAQFTPDFLAERADWGADDPAPIFVVGLPRSGSTLVEQILASHPAIEGTMELPYIGMIAGRIAEAGGFDHLATATRAQVRGWGQQYLDLARVHRRLGRTRFIDKLPGNFRHAGLIQLILPQARIIDVRRHPLASGFSCFKQLFAEGQDFSYDLGELAAWYRHYLALIRHFRSAAPGLIHTLIYEDLVEDTEAQVRQLLDAVGEPFDPATLRFFENSRAVRTVSSEQVRQPIYRAGLDHWRQFEAHLAPLASGLGPALADWRS